VNASAGLFDDVVQATGLVELIAPFTVSRLLVAADVSPQEMTREDLARALPTLERGLAVYLDADGLARAVERMRALAGA
jgi:hypothetical protein